MMCTFYPAKDETFSFAPKLTAQPSLYCDCSCIILSHSKIAALSWYSGQTAWREETSVRVRLI